MMGLEPTTFCMARNLRETTADASSWQSACSCGSRMHASDRNRQQETADPD
jgi:hypothetical protein